MPIRSFRSLIQLLLLYSYLSIHPFDANYTSRHIQDVHSNRSSRCLSWPRLSSNILQGLLHPVRLNRHLGLRQLQRRYYSLWFLHFCTSPSFVLLSASPNKAPKQPGYSAAVSQNEFGVGDGAGAGPACGTCWKLTASTDSSGNKKTFGNPIVVQVTNLCPADSNPLCAQNGLSGTNQYGANLNFDLCIDSGASAALFGSSGVGLAVGQAEQVDCSQWSGKVVH